MGREATAATDTLYACRVEAAEWVPCRAADLLPTAAQLPKAAAISSRIPLFAHSKDQKTLPITNSRSSSVASRVAGAAANYYINMTGQLTGTDPPTAGIRLAMGGPAAAVAAGSYDSPVRLQHSASINSLGSRPEDMERRRSAAATARTVLSLSDHQSADGSAVPRRAFPPGPTSMARFNAFTQVAAQGGLSNLSASPSLG